MTPKTRHRCPDTRRSRGFRRGGIDRDPHDTLAAARPGERVVIETIDCPQARAQALRFGIGEGATVRCQTVLPGGPVVVACGRQEIAIGRRLARRIRVRKEAV